MAGGDNRQAARESLENDQAESFAKRRKKQNVVSPHLCQHLG
jgi:hypothetical protein